MDTLRHGGDTAAIAQASGQLQGLSRLEHRLAYAGPAQLAALRAEITASVAATQVFIAQTREAVAAGKAKELALHEASEAARATVQGFVDDYYEKKIFEPYLRFASAEEEEAYRKREAERREAIAKARAEGTPEGDLRALQIARDQLRDAGAHGADKSPDFAPQVAKTDTAIASLEAALSAKSSTPEAPTKATAEAPSVEVDDVLASLKAAGVTLADQATAGHGVTQNAAGTAGTSRLV